MITGRPKERRSGPDLIPTGHTPTYTYIQTSTYFTGRTTLSRGQNFGSLIWIEDRREVGGRGKRAHKRGATNESKPFRRRDAASLFVSAPARRRQRSCPFISLIIHHTTDPFPFQPSNYPPITHPPIPIPAQSASWSDTPSCTNSHQLPSRFPCLLERV